MPSPASAPFALSPAPKFDEPSECTVGHSCRGRAKMAQSGYVQDPLQTKRRALSVTPPPPEAPRDPRPHALFAPSHCISDNDTSRTPPPVPSPPLVPASAQPRVQPSCLHASKSASTSSRAQQCRILPRQRLLKAHNVSRKHWIAPRECLLKGKRHYGEHRDFAQTCLVHSFILTVNGANTWITLT